MTTTTMNETLDDAATLEAEAELTRRWVAYGWTSFAVVFATAWFTFPRAAPIEEPLQRVLYALQLGAGPGIVLMLILQGLWRMQDEPGAEDPFRQVESRAFQINQRVMTNTVEQTLIFLPMFLALAVRMPPDKTFTLPLLMGFWCVARVLFWIGYRRAMHLRAPGMDWTSGVAMTTAVLLGTTLF